MLHLVRMQFSSCLLLWWEYLLLAYDSGNSQNCISEVVPFESSGIFFFFCCLHISWGILSTLRSEFSDFKSSLNNDLLYSLMFFKTLTCGRNKTWTSNREETGFLNLQQFGLLCGGFFCFSFVGLLGVFFVCVVVVCFGSVQRIAIVKVFFWRGYFTLLKVSNIFCLVLNNFIL